MSPGMDVAAPVLGVVVLLAIWTYGGRAEWAGGMVVTPLDAVEPLFGDSADVYRRAVTATVWSAVRGLLVGGGLAFAAALAAAAVPGLRRSITRLAAIANAAPWVAVAPCLLIVLGRDRGPVAVAAIAVFFYVFVSTSVGLGAASSAVHDVASALGSSRARRVWSVELPSAWPAIADGLRLAAPAALAGAVFGEWYGAERGLGVLLITAMQGARAPQLWAASLLSAGCGLLVYAGLGLLRNLAADRYGTTVTRTASAPSGGGRDHLLRTIAVESATVVGLVAVLTTVWWAWIEVGDVSPIVAPSPSAVLDDLVGAPGEYLAATWATLQTSAIALGVGVVIGLVAALAASRFELLAGMTVPLVVLVAATPLVALFPLFARVLGYNPTTVWALASVLVFYPVFVFTRSGLAAATRSSLDLVDALGADRGTRFRRLVLPAAVPHIVSGFRIATGSAVIAAVVGESLIGREGLGVEFAYAYRLLELPRAFGAAIVVVVVSVLVFAAVGKLEHAVHERWT
ncbi:MAG: ABC transporter permease subunit [Actinomycetota bacterium]|nr:ABC transporter permease subunit [Actinomycetota bacterium]